MTTTRYTKSDFTTYDGSEDPLLFGFTIVRTNAQPTKKK